MDLFDADFERELKEAAESIEKDFKSLDSAESFVERMARVLSGK